MRSWASIFSASGSQDRGRGGEVWWISEHCRAPGPGGTCGLRLLGCAGHGRWGEEADPLLAGPGSGRGQACP